MKCKCYLQALLVPAVFLISASAFSGTQIIDRDNYQGQWPFTFDRVELRCVANERYAVNLDNGEIYALNGMARTSRSKYKAHTLDLDSDVWLDNVESSSYGIGGVRAKISLSPMIDAAGELCGK